MVRRFLGRAVTSAPAFFVAGLVDFSAFWAGWGRDRLRRALGRRAD